MIDHNTVQQILDTADIVDVVGDFVSLKKRGTNWIGLCPFHNDRRPSFYVSRAKGICKCFACGEGGSAVNFIMKHEQLSYPEALRYLARKYHIEIQEKELTDEEKQAQSEREAMLMLNEWACDYFEKQLHETQSGQDIGLSYFRERGFNDATIKEFRLGYSSEGYDDLYKAAVSQGFNPQLLFDVGLCIPDERGGGRDRFRGRVMFPIMNIAGKVIAFGGRTLKKDKNIAKYVNSPESTIYSKRDVIYGLYQAKREISKQDKCFIVEGYADVISMHQAGFKNVIASSGTALTEGHIHAIRRFTSNVTEMFDGDAAGIKAAIRGVDMLLKEGLNIKVLPLPPEDDPDSFVCSRTPRTTPSNALLPSPMWSSPLPSYLTKSPAWSMPRSAATCLTWTSRPSCDKSSSIAPNSSSSGAKNASNNRRANNAWPAFPRPMKRRRMHPILPTVLPTTRPHNSLSKMCRTARTGLIMSMFRNARSSGSLSITVCAI